MRNGKTAEEINKELISVQETWYKQLLKTDSRFEDDSQFSSPFCFGVSEKEWNDNVIMYIGEEARGWWFDDEKHHESEIEYLQGYAISYFERQLHENYKCNNQFCTDYSSSFETPNPSKFWEYTKAVKKETMYSICWNNLDKLHRIKTIKENGVKKRLTVALTRKQEEVLHDIHPANNCSLLLNEINIVQPKIVIFTKYIHSTAKALGINEDQLWKIKNFYAHSGKCVANISDLCKSVFARENTIALLLLNHPNCRKKNFLQEAIKQTVEAIAEATKN